MSGQFQIQYDRPNGLHFTSMELWKLFHTWDQIPTCVGGISLYSADYSNVKTEKMEISCGMCIYAYAAWTTSSQEWTLYLVSLIS